MYIPPSFREDDTGALHELMRRYNFAALVTEHEGAPFATHLPFVLDAGRGPLGALRGHMARANPQWRGFDGEREALVIFQGPHAYISPSWYAPESGPSVPTWNYAVAHAYGAPRVVEEPAAVRAAIEEIVAAHDPALVAGGRLDLPEAYLERMLRALVAFEIPIARLEGKLKLSQNRGEEDRRRVAVALAEGDDPLGRQVAEMMR